MFLTGKRGGRPAAGAGGGGGDSFAHGDEVTITGSGFGSMPTFFFAGGEAGILETTTTGQIPDSGHNTEGPDTNLGFNWIRFSNPSPGARAVIISDGTRGKVLGRSSSYDESSQECRFSSGVGFSSKIMVKFYARYNTSSGGGDPQYKIGTFQAGLSDISDVNGSNFKVTVLNGSPMAYNVPSGGTGEETWYLPAGPTINNAWNRIEQKVITPSSQGAGNGQMYYRAMRGSVESYISDTGANVGTQLQSEVNMYPNSLRYTAYTWQNWGGNGLTANGMGIDDHYVQVGSFACVELWNTTNPATATIREIQEPTSWSSTSITVRLNQGGVAAGDYFLVVLDDSVTDTVLASRAITVT